MSDTQPNATPPNNKGPIIVIVIVASIIAVASVLAILLFNGLASKEPRSLHFDNTNPPAQRTRPDAPPEQMPHSVPAQEPSEADRPAPDSDEFWDDAREAARELNDGEDPTPCENPCDCPQGMDCQLGSQLCIPGPFPVYCCENDGCPEGEQCQFEDGTFGECSPDE